MITNHRVAKALFGPQRTTADYVLTYHPKRGSHFPWLDSATTIRYSHDEVIEHPLTAAVAGLTPGAEKALWQARVRPVAKPDGGERLVAVADAPLSTRTVLLRLGLATGKVWPSSNMIALTTLGVEAAKLLGHP